MTGLELLLRTARKLELKIKFRLKTYPNGVFSPEKEVTEELIEQLLNNDKLENILFGADVCSNNIKCEGSKLVIRNSKFRTTPRSKEFNFAIR